MLNIDAAQQSFKSPTLKNPQMLPAILTLIMFKHNIDTPLCVATLPRERESLWVVNLKGWYNDQNIIQ